MGALPPAPPSKSIHLRWFRCNLDCRLRGRPDRCSCPEPIHDFKHVSLLVLSPRLKIRDHSCWSEVHWLLWINTLSPLNCKEIKPANPKGNQSWIFTGRPDAEAETPVLWPPDAKNWLIGKDPDAGKDWRREEKGITEDKMIEWHHWLDGHEFEQASGVGDGQGSLSCCRPWRSKGHTWLSNRTDLN